MEQHPVFVVEMRNRRGAFCLLAVNAPNETAAAKQAAAQRRAQMGAGWRVVNVRQEEA